MIITGQQVKEAVIAAGITYVFYRHCTLCGLPIGYTVCNGLLYFDHSCSCSKHRSALEPESWEEAAHWINLQDTEAARRGIMSRFGLKEQV